MENDDIADIGFPQSRPLHTSFKIDGGKQLEIKCNNIAKEITLRTFEFQYS